MVCYGLLRLAKDADFGKLLTANDLPAFRQGKSIRLRNRRPWGNFGPGTPNPIVGFRPVLAPASKLPEANIPEANIPEDERVVSL